MTAATGDIIDRAIAWHLRLADASTEDWHSFVLWLEADEAHRQAYDQVTMDDALLAPSLELNAAPIAANDVAPAGKLLRWSMAGGGVAAAAALAVAMLPQQVAVAYYSVETAPGATRTVKLDDGTTIDMNGGTRMTFRRGDARYAALDSGEATFHVRHDADHPFELTSGKYVIRDLGTIFNVARDGSRLGVQVAEGSVMFAPDQQKMTLTPGMALTVRDDRKEAMLDRVATNSVGGWRHGVVSFRNAPLESVANAVSRSTGARVKLDPAIAGQSFTGTIHLTGGQESVIPRMAALMDMSVRRDGGDWTLMHKDDEGR